MKSATKYALILASGGIDSTACIRFYKKLKFEIDVLFFDYGQAASQREFKALKLISKSYQIIPRKIRLTKSNKFKDGLVIGRNAFLIFSALMLFERKSGLIAIGIHKGTSYYDCSNSFIEQLQVIVDQYTQGTIKIAAPFLRFNKKEIWDYCIMEKVPLQLTYSCELGENQPCNKCSTCKDLKKLYVSKN